MVGMSGQDREGAINLLQQHDSHKLMGPGRGAEGEAEVGALAQHLAEAIGAADGEENGSAAGIVPGPQPAGEGLTGHTVAAPVQGDDNGAVGDHARECDRFLEDATFGLACAAVPDLDDLNVADAEGAAGLGRPLAVAFGKLALGPGLEPADRGNHDPHGPDSTSPVASDDATAAKTR